MTTTDAGLGDAQHGIDPRLPYVALACVVFAWGSGPVVTKLITVVPVVGALIRFAISVPLLYAIVALRRGRVTATTLRMAAPAGLVFGINLIIVFEAVQEATIAVLAVATALQPAVVLLISGPVFGERPTRKHVAWTVVGVVGAALVILGAGSELRSSGKGVIFAISAMSTFTIYFVLTRRVRSTDDVDPVEWMAAVNLWALAALVPASFVLADLSDFESVDRGDWLWIVVLAYGTGVFGHVVMSWAHRYVQASRSSLSLLTMNLVAVGLAWPVHGESVTWIQAAGGVVVIGAVAAVLRTPVAVSRT